MNIQEFININYNDNEIIANMYINNENYGTSTYYSTARKLAVNYNRENEYMSMNPVSYRHGKINRDKSHVSKLKWLYVDLDYYKSEYNYMTKTQLLCCLQQDYFNQKVPYPTLVIDSGRGIYLLWKVEENIKALPKWTKMQTYLYNQLKDFGADPQVVTDSARVLRKIGSTNSKSGTVVTVMEYEGKKYSLSSLIHEFFPDDDIATEKMMNYAKWIADTLNIELPEDNKYVVRKFIRDNLDKAETIAKANKNMLSYANWISQTIDTEIPGDNIKEIRKYIEIHADEANLLYQMQKAKSNEEKKLKKAKVYHFRSEYAMYTARIKDLETLLLKYRDKEGGYREYILFLYRYYNLCVTGSKEISLQNTIQLNNKLHNPLDQMEVVIATRSAEKYYDNGKTYKRKNKHIIDKLEITEDEMQDMKCFVSKKVKNERKREKNRKAYLMKLEQRGKTTKTEAIAKRNMDIYELILQGKDQKEICKMLNISRSTFYSAKKQIDFTSISDAKKCENEIEECKVDFIEVDPVEEKECDYKYGKYDSPKNSALVINNKAFRPVVYKLDGDDPFG